MKIELTLSGYMFWHNICKLLCHVKKAEKRIIFKFLRLIRYFTAIGCIFHKFGLVSLV